MYRDLTQPITETDALADPDPLFGGAPALPDDLLQRGFKLIIRDTGRMFAVSREWGCTGTKPTIGGVVTEARSLIKFIEWAERKEESPV